jgi:hypothetical protein
MGHLTIFHDVRTDALQEGDIVAYEDVLYCVAQKPTRSTKDPNNAFMDVVLQEQVEEGPTATITSPYWAAGWVVARII